MQKQQSIETKALVDPDHDKIERPTKRQKSETGEATLDIVTTVLTDIGTANYNRGDYHAAEECFYHALCQGDIDCMYSSEEMKNLSDKYINKPLLLPLSQETFLTKRRLLAMDENKKTTNYNTDNTRLKKESIQLDKIHEDTKIRKQYKEVEYDEGMKVYQSLLQIQEATSTAEIGAILCYNIGQTYVQRKLHNDAIVWFHKSLDKFFSNYSNNNKLISIVANLHSLAYCLYKIGRDEDATTFYKRALDIILEHNLDGTHLAASYNCLGVILFNKHQQPSDPDLIMKMFLKSLDLYKSYQNKKKNNPHSCEKDIFMIREIATVLNNIGRVYFSHSNFEKALIIYKECLELRQISLECDSVDIAATAYNLGQTYHQLGHLDDALSYYHQFLNIMTSVMGSTFKDNALVYKGIAEIYHDKSNFELSLHFYDQALQIQMIHSNDHPNPEVAATLNKLGNLCYEMKDFASALKSHRRCLKMQKAFLQPNHPYIIITTTNIGHIHKQLGQHRHALSAYQQVYKMQQELFGLNSFVLAETLSSIGLMQYHLKRHESSFDSYQEVLRIRREHLATDDHPDIASTLNMIGLVLLRQNMYGTAKNCFEESLRIRTKLLGKDHRDVAILWYNLATIHFETGEDELAIQMYKETLRVERLALGNDHPNAVLTLQHLGQVYQQLGLAEKAIEYFNEALAIERNRKFEGSTNNENSKKMSIQSLAKILNLLGNAYLQLGRTSEMMECTIEASRIYESNRSFGETVVIGGFNLYSLTKTKPTCAPVA